MGKTNLNESDLEDFIKLSKTQNLVIIVGL